MKINIFNCILLESYDMMSEDQIRIELLDFNNHDGIETIYCAFNLNGELILYNCIDNKGWDHFKYVICIYSLQTNNDKLMYKCKRMYWTTGNVMSIQKDDKLYLSSSLSNNSVYEFDLATEKKIKIVGSSEVMTIDDGIKVI
jgi:hypothetical protein